MFVVLITEVLNSLLNLRKTTPHNEIVHNQQHIIQAQKQAHQLLLLVDLCSLALLRDAWHS